MTKKTARKRHSEEFKGEALQLAEQCGVTQAARQLSIHSSRIYQWRVSRQKKASTSERESTLATENARLKRQLAEQAEELAIVKKAATYFAKNQK